MSEDEIVSESKKSDYSRGYDDGFNARVKQTQPQQKEQFSREDACKFAETIALSQWWYSKDTQDWHGSNESYGEIKTTDQLLTEYLDSKTSLI